MKKIIFICWMTFGLNACKYHSLEGDCPYPLKFSPDHIFFNANGGTIVCTTNNKAWWILANLYTGEYGEDFNEEYSVFYEQDPYTYYEKVIKIEGSWFLITKENNQTIIFSIKQNDTGKDRSLVLPIEERNCFTIITVNQSSE